MIRLHRLRLVPVFLCIVALSVFLPEIWKRAVQGDSFYLLGQFSVRSGEFVLWESGPSELVYRKEDGTPLSMREARGLAPFFFSYDVEKWGGFPMSLGGRSFTFAEARVNQYLRLYPSLVSSSPPALYMFFESEPETASLELPLEFMTVDADGVRFLNCASGEENRDKSRLFTQAMRDAGAVFPLKAVGHNPNPLKTFDEGMFFVDSAGGLFQLKMRQGAPFCLNSGLTVTGKVLHILVDEHRRKEFYAVVVTEKETLLFLYQGALLPLPLEGYDPLSVNLSGSFDPLNRSFLLRDTDAPASVELLATDGEYRVLRRFSAAYPQKILDRRVWEDRGLSLLAPFHPLRYDKAHEGITLFFRQAPDPLFAALGMFIWISSHLLLRRGRPWREQLAPCALCALFGLSALAPLLLFGPITETNNENRL